CLEIKTVDLFGTDRISKDGLRYRCKKCESLKKPSLRRSIVLEGVEKQCVVCLKTKDLTFFKRRQGRSYTHEPRCKQCEKEKKYVDLGIFKDGKRRCSCCLNYKSLDNFYKIKSKGTVTSTCKVCQNIKSKLYRESLTEEERRYKKRQEYLKNREGYLRRGKNYRINNREKYNSAVRKYEKNLRYTDYEKYLRRNISSLIRGAFKKAGYSKNNKKTVSILKCSL